MQYQYESDLSNFANNEKMSYRCPRNNYNMAFDKWYILLNKNLNLNINLKTMEDENEIT